MQIWAESGKSALPICNYSQILYQFLTFTQNLKRSLLRTGSVYPGNGSTRYNHQRGNEFKSVPFTASTASNQSFTIPGSANFYHSSPEPLAGGLVAQSDVSLSNGKSLSVIVGVPSDDPYAK